MVKFLKDIQLRNEEKVVSGDDNKIEKVYEGFAGSDVREAVDRVKGCSQKGLP